MEYHPPSDFSLPSPPYYRPASSVTLTCTVHDAIDTVQYQWTSTQNRSFVSWRNESSIFQRLLTAYDAGLHTCTVTDEWGNIETATTEMNLFGKCFSCHCVNVFIYKCTLHIPGMGIYVEESEYIVTSPVANNTHIHHGNCGYRCTRISFSCFTNKTDVVVAMHYPVIRRYIYSYGDYRVTDPWQKVDLASQSGLNMSVYRRGSIYDDVAFGTYSCVVSDQHSNESQQIMAVGIYESRKNYNMKHPS